MKGRSGWSDKILESGVIDTTPRSAADIAELLGTQQTTIRGALGTLYNGNRVSCDIDSTTGIRLWRRCGIHWIWSKPISRNPPKCFGERCWL